MPEPVKPNIAALGSRLLNPTDDFSPEAGSIELLKTEIKEPELTSTSILKPIFTEEASTTEINKSKKPIFTKSSSNIEIMKSVMKPKPILSEEAGSIEIMKSQMKPKPVFTEETGSMEIMKSKPPRKKKEVEMKQAETQTEPKLLKPSESMAGIIQEVFNRPITTKSLFEQIAKTQPPAEAYPDIPPYAEEIIPKQRPPRKDKGVQRGSIKERVFAEGVEQGLDIGIPAGRDVQNTEVMDIQQSAGIPVNFRLRPNEQNQPASSSSEINFA
jgi:hypothetical protein